MDIIPLIYFGCMGFFVVCLCICLVIVIYKEYKMKPELFYLRQRINDLESLLSLKDYVTLYPGLEAKACEELRWLKKIIKEIENEDQA